MKNPLVKLNIIYLGIFVLLTVLLSLLNIFIYGSLGNSYTTQELTMSLIPTNMLIVGVFVLPQMVIGTIYLLLTKQKKLDLKILVILMLLMTVASTVFWLMNRV